MGCSASKLDYVEAVQLCRDRKNFIKQAIEQRNKFASCHMAYIQSLLRVSAALIQYFEADDHHDFFFDSYINPPFTSTEKLNHETSGVPRKFLKPTKNEPKKGTANIATYIRSCRNPSVSVEEEPEQEETMLVESSSEFHASPVNQSSFFSSLNNTTRHGTPSSRAPQSDHFWNPFSSLDPYGYSTGSSFDRIVNDDDETQIRQIREAEGIPELEEDVDTEKKDSPMFWKVERKNEKPKAESKYAGVQVASNPGFKRAQEVKDFKSQVSESVEASEYQGAANQEAPNQQVVAGNNGAEEPPGFTVYVNRRPASMVEVMKELENQFMQIGDCANAVSVMLEASRAKSYPSLNELAVRMLNSVALSRPTTSHSSSAWFWQAASSSKGDANESNEYLECCMVSGSHQSTLDRLYEWEKRLYEEVKSGERVRIAYQKKCKQLRSHDIKGEEPSMVDKTRAAIRDLHAQFKVYIHTVESISKRIEALRDAELCPQLMELIQGLAGMWRKMADCHRIQKRTIEEAKLLLFSASGATPPKPPNAAKSLEAELRNWRHCLTDWIHSQRSYAGALAGWVYRCAPRGIDDAAAAAAGRELPSAFGVCVRWYRMLESVSEAMAVEGIEFFTVGMASVSMHQQEAARAAAARAAKEAERVEKAGSRVVCAGMSVAVGSLAEFAVGAAEGYDALVMRWRRELRMRGVGV